MECWGLKPCWVDDRGTCGMMVLRISLSNILDGVHRRETGL